ncbi:MAG TPA: hypothetical protein VKG82_05745 [Solirubrobacteraceae bacterium]|nr:hypothetical protein [Solirubrobacteraceae bacterium]
MGSNPFTGLGVKNFIDTQDFSREELGELMGLIRLLKEADVDAAVPQLLRHCSLGMIFEEPSTRTRVSFEVAMAKLGGHALYLKPGEIHLGGRDQIPERKAAFMPRYQVNQQLMARAPAHAKFMHCLPASRGCSRSS